MPHYERELALVPVQSSQLHARIRSADTADALAMPGVLARLDRCRGRARLQLVELFTTETVLFVGQIIGVISADNGQPRHHHQTGTEGLCVLLFYSTYPAS